jgi:hypothetical protein
LLKKVGFVYFLGLKDGICSGPCGCGNVVEGLLGIVRVLVELESFRKLFSVSSFSVELNSFVLGWFG